MKDCNCKDLLVFQEPESGNKMGICEKHGIRSV